MGTPSLVQLYLGISYLFGVLLIVFSSSPGVPIISSGRIVQDSGWLPFPHRVISLTGRGRRSRYRGIIFRSGMSRSGRYTSIP